LRGNGRDLWRQIERRPGAIAEPRVVAMPLASLGEEKLRAFIESAALVVPAFGYRARTLPLFDAQDRRLALNADSGGASVDDRCRMMLADGRVLPNVFGIGLGSGYRPSGSMGGETIQQLTYSTMRFGSGFFYGDPDLNGTIDEMRVYTGVLSAGDAINDYQAGPNTLVTPGSPVAPVTIHASLSGSTLTLTWSAGVLLQADNVTGPWTIVNNAVSGYTVSTAAAARKFYRVRVE
jgi:hypothetical protein